MSYRYSNRQCQSILLGPRGGLNQCRHNATLILEFGLNNNPEYVSSYAHCQSCIDKHIIELSSRIEYIQVIPISEYTGVLTNTY